MILEENKIPAMTLATMANKAYKKVLDQEATTRKYLIGDLPISRYGKLNHHHNLNQNHTWLFSLS